MTPKQTLLAHIAEWHRRQPPKNATLAELQRWHGREHHRLWCSHIHEGANDGPNNRPIGWYTGEGAVAR